MVKTPLLQNGDFRSEESIELLKEADIVVTNEPFSLFREYVAQLMEYDKKFLIIGNKNAITYKEFFPLLKENKVWIGYNSPSEFNTPDGMTKKVNGLCRWFTNLDIDKRHEKIDTGFYYYHNIDGTPVIDADKKYPKYDNYDAINVDKVSEIPMDYYGVMGVPVTYMDKHNPDQFEIVGCADYTGKYGSDDIGVSRIGETWIKKYREQGGRGHYTANMTSLVYYDTKGSARNTFKRILIKRKEKINELPWLL